MLEIMYIHILHQGDTQIEYFSFFSYGLSVYYR